MYFNWIWSLIVLVVVYVFSRLAFRIILRSEASIETKHKMRSSIYWVRAAVFLFCLMIIWSELTQGFGVFIGMIGAGLALSLQETILCAAGWVLIVIKKPFDIGDRIEVDEGTRGDVVDINIFHTLIVEISNWTGGEQPTGRFLHIPNSFVFRGKLSNYTKGFPFIWNEIETVVTFESDWQKAKEVILQLSQEQVGKYEKEVEVQVEEMQRLYAVRYDNLAPVIYTSIADHGVALTLRYLTPIRKRRWTTKVISEGILSAFKKESSIDFAYPTTRYYDNRLEGKSGSGGPAPVPGE